MTIQELLEERRIYKGTIAKATIVAAFERAQRDLNTAHKVLDIDTDWAFSIAYNGVLQASRAFMFAQGYRPASNEGHKNTFAFMLVTVDDAHKPLIVYFDRMRVKRHQVTYDAAGVVTETETRSLLAKAEEYLAWVHHQIRPFLEETGNYPDAGLA
jgi:uncharacterized protein (UPF0332 family)